MKWPYPSREWIVPGALVMWRGHGASRYYTRLDLPGQLGLVLSVEGHRYSDRVTMFVTPQMKILDWSTVTFEQLMEEVRCNRR